MKLLLAIIIFFTAACEYHGPVTIVYIDKAHVGTYKGRLNRFDPRFVKYGKRLKMVYAQR